MFKFNIFLHYKSHISQAQCCFSFVVLSMVESDIFIWLSRGKWKEERMLTKCGQIRYSRSSYHLRNSNRAEREHKDHLLQVLLESGEAVVQEGK